MTEFEEIWKEYYPRLTVYLRTSFHFNDEIDDLVQEIMFKIHRSLPSFNRRRSLSGWIYSIAHNHAVDSLRKQTNRLKLVEKAKNNAETFMTGQSAPETIIIDRELREGIGNFISGLPEPEQQTAFLRFYEELSYKEISRITGTPEGTLKYHVHSIRKKLAGHYGEEYEE